MLYVKISRLSTLVTNQALCKFIQINGTNSINSTHNNYILPTIKGTHIII